MFKCALFHSWSKWSMVPSEESLLESWRVCVDCGRLEKGESLRLLNNRDKVLAIHTDVVRPPAPLKLEHG
jgi:hypothetical protein